MRLIRAFNMKKLFLGIELGSTRIKSVLINARAKVLAQGSHEWENSLNEGYWSYSLDEVWSGLRASYSDLNANYKKKYGKDITEITAIGISAMMHGYLAFDKDDNLLVPFRTWRNTNTERAAKELTKMFSFNIPERWSIAHFYQAVLDNEQHVEKVSYFITLAGYVHYKLTGKKVLGVGDASGMFPIKEGNYDKYLLAKCNAFLWEKGLTKDLLYLLPKILYAGDKAGCLTEDGAKLLDPTGHLKAGAIFCPPEGDAGTGMVATNSIAPKTANVSAGTSAFLMAVLEKNLEHYYREIDIVTTPTGDPVAMVHVNNFTNEINAWVDLFEEVAVACGTKINKNKLVPMLFNKSRESDEDCGKLIGYNFVSGEPIAQTHQGRPLLARLPEGKLGLANFMQMQIYSALGSLAMGMEILKKENVQIDCVCGHGGFFKTDFIGQNAMSAAVGAPVTVMKNAGEGGAWGIALLALYTTCKNLTLSEFLDGIFANSDKVTVTANEKERAKFKRFLELYKHGLPIEILAGMTIKDTDIKKEA